MTTLYSGRPNALSSVRRALIYADPSALPWSEEEYWDRYTRACAAIGHQAFSRIEEREAMRALRTVTSGEVPAHA